MNEKFLQKLSFVTKKSLLTSVVGSVALLGGSVFGATSTLTGTGLAAQNIAAGDTVNVINTADVGNNTVNLGSAGAGIATLNVLEGSTLNGASVVITGGNGLNRNLVINNIGQISSTGGSTISLDAVNNAQNIVINNTGVISTTAVNAIQYNANNNGILEINIIGGDETPRIIGAINASNAANTSAFNILDTFTTEGVVEGPLNFLVANNSTFTAADTIGASTSARGLTVEAGSTMTTSAAYVGGNGNVPTDIAGTLNVGADMTVANTIVTGTMNINAGTFTDFNAGFNGANGTVNIATGATANLVTGANFANGTLNLNGGTLNIDGAALVAGQDGTIALNGGTLTLTTGNAINVNDAGGTNSILHLVADTTISKSGAGGATGGLVLNNAKSLFKVNLGVSEPLLTLTNIADAGAPADLTNSTVGVNVDGYIPNGKVYTIIDSSVADVLVLAANHNYVAGSIDTDLTFAGALATGTGGVNTAYQLTATRTRLLHDKIGVPEQKDVSEGLDRSAVTNTDLRAVLGETLQLNSDSLKDGVGQYFSDKMGGAHTGVVMSADRVTNASFMHLAELRDDATYAAGGHSSGLGGWGKVFGTSAEQKERKGVQGHDVGSFGLSVGFDKMLSNKFTMGAGVGYASTEVKSRLSAASKVDVDTWQVVGYGSYTGGKFFMDGALSYSGNKFDRTRVVKGATTSYNYVADHNGHNFGAKFLVGFNMGTSMMVTPTLGLSYVKSKQDGYTEKADSRAASALVVGESTVDMLKGKVGLEFSKAFKSKGGGMSRPSLELAVAHDFTGDENSATYHFNSPNAPTFVVKGPKPAETSFLLGLGWRHEGGHKEFGVRYDLEVKDQFMSHAGMATFRYNW